MSRYGADLGGPDPVAALQGIMSDSVSYIRMPADLLDRAASRNRRRKAHVRLTGAVGAVAVVAALAIAVAAVPGRSSGRPAFRRQTTGLQAQTAAYVLDRAAVAQVNSYRMISVDQNAGSGLVYTDVATQQQRIVSSLLDSSGQPYFQQATAIVGGVYTETDVEYQHHVYSTFTTSSVDDGGPVTLSSFLPLQTSQHPAVAFRQALKAGVIALVGHRRLDGRDTILIRVRTTSRQNGVFAGLKVGRGKLAASPPSWIWLDASTYLVVQTEHFVPGFPGRFSRSAPGSKMTWLPVIDHVTWLSPTRRNLALLTVTPPAGFTKIPYAELAQKYLGPIS